MEPHILVIFGASGDLTERKLIPAVFQLFRMKLLPEPFALVGISRSELTDEAFRQKVVTDNPHLQKHQPTAAELAAFLPMLHYEAIDTASGADYARVKTRLTDVANAHGTGQRYIFYLSTPPKLYEIIPGLLAEHGLNRPEGGWSRLIIEKPFGYDGPSASRLNAYLLRHFGEDQIYRIDHYLGKETVQNLLVTRFANGIFEPLWNRNYIDYIQITSAEDIGVENRGGYYDESGALRDMFQNHLLQIVAHIAMEPPISADAQAIRNEKLKLFQSIRPIQPEQIDQYVVRGQYLAATINGETSPAYRDETGVKPHSRTETFAALKFFIDNWRWAGVPFYVRTGKRLPTKVTEVVVSFKLPPQRLFRNVQDMHHHHNLLVIRIQPHEGLALQFGMKVPGQGFQVKDVNMDFHYADLTDAYVPEAYERLILDSMRGDATLYARGDSVEAAWQWVDPILAAWHAPQSNLPLYGYPAGTWGPPEADALFGSDGAWRNPCPNLTDNGGFCEL